MMGGIWVMLFSHLHVHVCRDITGIIAVSCGLGRPQHELIQLSNIVRKINRTAARLTEAQHMLTAVRSLAKSSNASCNILYHLMNFQ